MRDGREADARADTVNHQKRSEQATVSAGFADPRTRSKQWLINVIAPYVNLRSEWPRPCRVTEKGFDLLSIYY
jgi:hypothetical protein